jgi:hypothetical protein
MMWVVTKGSPVEGFSLYGPFHSEEEAMAWGTAEYETDPDWWPMVVEVPEGYTSLPGADNDLSEVSLETLEAIEAGLTRNRMPQVVAFDLSGLPIEEDGD